MKTILQDSCSDEISADCHSRSKLFSLFTHSFVILPEKETIIAPSKSIFSHILVREERLNDNSKDILTFFGESKSIVNSILYNPSLMALLACELSGNVIQYDLSQGRSNYKVVKNYGNLGMGQIHSCVNHGRFAFVAGEKSCFLVIDLFARQIVVEKISSAIQKSSSMKICKVKKDTTLLCLSGINPNYSDSKTDVFDISDLVNKV